MTLLRESAAVAGKDLRIEVRGRYALGAVMRRSLPATAEIGRAHV